MTKIKKVRTAGCLLLLCAIICGCALLGRQTEVSAETGQGNESDISTVLPPTDDPPVPQAPAAEGSVTVAPTYTEGLTFRSNGDGTCALSGLGSFTGTCLLIPPTSPAGDKVTAILPFALSESMLSAIELPATMELLDASSFAGCRRLVCVRVAPGNRAFAEYGGVLYDAAGTTLIYCPAAIASVELQLSPTLRRIHAAAFAECTSLVNVVFPGSAAAWHAIIVGDDNAPLYAAGLKLGT